MALTFREVGLDEAGVMQYDVTSDSPNPHFVFTGKHAEGTVSLPDGTSYDVTPAWIEVDSHEHAGQVAHLIGEQHEVSGKLGDFRHDCTDHCGPLRREV